jgi:hypothetical protein
MVIGILAMLAAIFAILLELPLGGVGAGSAQNDAIPEAPTVVKNRPKSNTPNAAMTANLTEFFISPLSDRYVN